MKGSIKDTTSPYKGDIKKIIISFENFVISYIYQHLILLFVKIN